MTGGMAGPAENRVIQRELIVGAFLAVNCDGRITPMAFKAFGFIKRSIYDFSITGFDYHKNRYKLRGLKERRIVHRESACPDGSLDYT